ncbi:MAG: YecA family protein [Chlorobiaceae bacterium]|nr:YecA family protein [Chlorobiaceae bacterium]NTV61745.1 YecA family protein [Chlorobiaceae bacterium]
MNSSDPLLQPLSIEELGLLENFLLSDTAPEESMTSIEMVDGYMTALIAGPELPHPDVWISCIWDQESGESPAFSSEEEASLLREFLLRHMNSIAMQFEDDPEGFLPLYEKIGYPDDEEMAAAVEDWALGFTTGMELTHEAWKPFFSDDEVAVLAFPVFVLGRITDDYESMSEDDLGDLVRRLPDFIIRIHEYWQGNR